MDMYTVFALTAVVLGMLAMLVGIVFSLDARRQVTLNRATMIAWCSRMLDDRAAVDKLNQRVSQTLAERVRNLEVFRVNHATRLNQAEDLIDLLNHSQDPLEDSRGAARSEPGAGTVTVEDYEPRWDRYTNGTMDQGMSLHPRFGAGENPNAYPDELEATQRMQPADFDAIDMWVPKPY
jgi:hypothetical protein